MRNVCNCPRPPGGQASCSADQLAICRVINGSAHTECVDLPPMAIAGDRQQFKNWTLSHVQGRSRAPFAPITPADELILKRGQYRTARVHATFKFPST